MREIPLTQGQVALVDDEDFERLSSHKWYAIRVVHKFYAVRTSYNNGHQTRIYMHHEILGGKPEIGEVDHINGGGLNNQKNNLRVVTRSQNKMNQHYVGGTSRFKGVCWVTSRNKWQANIKLSGKSRHLGRFDSEEGAARAYDVAALEHFGEFARLNFAA